MTQRGMVKAIRTMTNRSEIIKGHISMFRIQEPKLSPKIVELIFCYSLGKSLCIKKYVTNLQKMPAHTFCQPPLSIEC